MLFWIFVTVIALLAAAYILRPLWLDETDPANQVDALDVYKRQLAELDRDVEAGLVPEAEAAATRSEIERRLLEADKDLQSTGKKPSSLSKNQRIAASVIVALAFPLIALVLYAGEGAPGYGDLPYKDRCDALSQSQPSEQDMRQLIDCLAVRMDQDPQAEGLSMLGRSYIQMGRYADAARAYARAVEVGGPSLESLEGLGVSIVYLNQGRVTEGARTAFAEAAQQEGDTTFAEFYLAEYDYQHGKEIEALSTWVDLLEVTPKEAPIFAVIDNRIKRGLAEQQSAAGSAPQDMQSVVQSDQVKSMVAGLAARLEENPDDLQGWLMLIRSYHVQGRNEEAQDALSRATLNFLNDPAALKEIVGLAESLGMTPSLEPPLTESE